MSRTIVGRYIYAVGGNAEAARLSGVPVKKSLFGSMRHLELWPVWVVL